MIDARRQREWGEVRSLAIAVAAASSEREGDLDKALPQPEPLARPKSTEFSEDWTWAD